MLQRPVGWFAGAPTERRNVVRPKEKMVKCHMSEEEMNADTREERNYSSRHLKVQAYSCRTNGLVSAFVRRLPLVLCLSLAMSTRATVPSSDLPDLGSLQNFVEFGNQQADSLATINGNVGLSRGGTLDFTAPATINGNLYLNTPVTFNDMGVITGTTFTGQNLVTEQDTVISASRALAALPADETITENQTTALNFDVPAGQVEVVDLNGGLTLNYQNISLTGGGSLVLNIEGSFSLNGSAGILGNPANTYINYLDGSPITADVASTIDGMLFDADVDADLDGTVNGSIYGGDGTITIDSGGTVNADPVPEPKELMFSGLAAFLVHMARRRLCRRI